MKGNYSFPHSLKYFCFFPKTLTCLNNNSVRLLSKKCLGERHATVIKTSGAIGDIQGVVFYYLCLHYSPCKVFCCKFCRIILQCYVSVKRYWFRKYGLTQDKRNCVLRGKHQILILITLNQSQQNQPVYTYNTAFIYRYSWTNISNIKVIIIWLKVPDIKKNWKINLARTST